MVVNVVELLHIAVQVKLPVAGVHGRGVGVAGPRVLGGEVWRGLDLHGRAVPCLLGGRGG